MPAVLRRLPAIVAVLCVAGFVPWILGVPGVEGSDYASGWMLGLYAILIYPAAMLGLAVLALVHHFLRLGPAAPLRARIGWAALAAFVLVQGLAWWKILS